MHESVRQANHKVINQHLMELLSRLNAHSIAFYYPMPNEVDPLPTLQHMLRIGKQTSLPCILEPNAPMAFVEWTPQDHLLKNVDYNFFQPLVENGICTPEIIIVPTLSFDDAGNRLGYGKGFYDYTLAQLLPEVTAIGLCYSCLNLKYLPHEPHDQKLDYAVTEKGIIRFSRR